MPSLNRWCLLFQEKNSKLVKLVKKSCRICSTAFLNVYDFVEPSTAGSE